MSHSSAASAAASAAAPTALHALTSTAASPALFFADTQFSNLGLDTRLWKSLAHAHMSRLTLVQSAAIPRMLEGNNVLVQAKTGTGKTLAYAVPIVQQILLEQTSDPPSQTRMSRIVLVPSLELCEQVRKSFQSLLKYCDDCVRVVALKSETIDPALIRENPDIIVATPSQLLNYCQNSAEVGRKKASSAYMADLPNCLKHLVIDEADLVLGQGYEEDLTALLNNSKFLGKGFQISLFSATLDEQIEELKNLYMPPPVVTIKIKDPIGSALGKAKLTQLYYQVNSRQDKFFMTVCLLQTGLISASSKLLIFVNNIPDAYKLKLFLEQYSINSAVLNHELPRNSRMSILDHFNRGVIDILIATDEATGEEADAEDEEDEQVKEEDEDDDGNAKKKSKKRTQDGQLKEEAEEASENPYAPRVEITVEETLTKKRKKGAKAADEEDEEMDDEADEESKVKKEEPMAEEEEDVDAALARLNKLSKKEREKKRKARKKAAAAGGAASSNVSRGVDFKDVATVLNFDFPTSLANYTHRCGRTARANASGVALSFVEESENEMLELVLYSQYEKRGGMPLESAPGDLQPLPFNPSDLDAFRYRANDVIRRVTKVAVREARLKEIKMELLNSERLRSHFEDNPRELALLKHDQVLRSKGIQKHLSVVPSYLLPEYMQQAAAAAASAPGGVSVGESDANRNKLRRNKHKQKIAAQNAYNKAGIDKLKGFALKKAKGRHTVAMKNAADPLRTFRAKPLNAAAASSGASSSSAAGKSVDF